jgi:hypothetical protein
MNTKVVDYTHFDGHTYRFSSTSKKENESKYLCNKYRLAGETALWGTRRQIASLISHLAKLLPGIGKEGTITH